MADEKDHVRLMFGSKLSGSNTPYDQKSISGREQFRSLAERHRAFAGALISSLDDERRRAEKVVAERAEKDGDASLPNSGT